MAPPREAVRSEGTVTPEGRREQADGDSDRRGRTGAGTFRSQRNLTESSGPADALSAVGNDAGVRRPRSGVKGGQSGSPASWAGHSTRERARFGQI